MPLLQLPECSSPGDGIRGRTTHFTGTSILGSESSDHSAQLPALLLGGTEYEQPSCPGSGVCWGCTGTIRCQRELGTRMPVKCNGAVCAAGQTPTRCSGMGLL